MKAVERFSEPDDSTLLWHPLEQNTANRMVSADADLVFISAAGLTALAETVESQPQQEPASFPTPSFLSTISAGQNPVKADWMRFTPTKTVSQSQ
jgi:hypothetical protein